MSNEYYDPYLGIDDTLYLAIRAILIVMTLIACGVCYYRLDKENAKLPPELQTFNTTKRGIYLLCCFCCPICCSGIVAFLYSNEIDASKRIAAAIANPGAAPVQTTNQYVQATVLA